MQMVSGLGGLRVKRYQPFFRQKQNFDENLWFLEKFFSLKMEQKSFLIWFGVLKWCFIIEFKNY